MALETVDVALATDALSMLTEVPGIGRRTLRLVRQSVAVGLTMLAALVSVAGACSLPVALLAPDFVNIAMGLRLARG